MCGIAGFASLQPTREHLAALERASRALQHRGPDDQGAVLVSGPEGVASYAGGVAALSLDGTSGPAVALASRRLAIIDCSPGGRQPMATADGRYHLVYNGEIYNYIELRRELEGLGCSFRSRSDTEVLLAACAVWGAGALARLEGMFALALLDTQKRLLRLARDGFGIKPLYYVETPGGLLFASEIGALLEFPEVSRRVNTGRLFEYFLTSNTDFGDETMFAAVRQVPPGHYLDIPVERCRALDAVRYWSPDNGERIRATAEEGAARVRELFLESVEHQLRSDVPVGFTLSGGIDSSAVLMAARHLRGPQAELHAFSYVADDPAISEEPFQDIVAGAANAVTHKIRVEPADLPRDFDRLVSTQDEPFGSPTIYVQGRIFEAAREAGIKVMLGGQGSDELFAGYNRYLAPRVVSLIREREWLAAARFLSASGRSPGVGRSGLLRNTVALSVPPAAQSLFRRFQRQKQRLDWVDYPWFEARGTVPTRPWRPRGREAMKELLAHALERAHLQALMRYEDRNAMAVSIENRVPFLSPRLARLAFSLPESQLLSPDGTCKAVLRDAMRGIVPDSVLDRRDKVGFAVPVGSWLLAVRPWVEQKLETARGLPGLRGEVLAGHWDAVVKRGSIPDAFLLWRWIGLAGWVERFGVTID
jgi:asparagine synthase (glutamine-hydrolysing)